MFNGYRIVIWNHILSIHTKIVIPITFMQLKFDFFVSCLLFLLFLVCTLLVKHVSNIPSIFEFNWSLFMTFYSSTILVLSYNIFASLNNMLLRYIVAIKFLKTIKIENFPLEYSIQLFELILQLFISCSTKKINYHNQLFNLIRQIKKL